MASNSMAMASVDDPVDWNDPAFSQFHDAMANDSPYRYDDFTTDMDHYTVDSPGMALRALSKSSAAAGAQNSSAAIGLVNEASAESSSQDSASDSSSRRKRKVTESPISDPATETGVPEDPMDMAHAQKLQQYEQYPSGTMHDMSMEQDGSMFDFNSAASSPIQPREFNTAMSLNAHVRVPASTLPPQYQQSPVSVDALGQHASPLTARQVNTINPGMFQLAGSRDQSPITNAIMFNNTSPNAMFSSASSNSEDAFAGPQAWSEGISQTPAWPGDFNSQFASPNPLAFTPSPVVNGATPALVSRGSATSRGRSPLHIAPISTKSRVETQINVIMTLEKPPPGVEHLHLPLHTIAKSKLLAKDEVDKTKTLELSTMLVCTSAMRNPQFEQKALQRAAAQSNAEIQRRAAALREAGDDDKNDMKNVDEADRPASGGEVRICNNCIQRERKRAGRKKLKKEEEQQHWERYETERVVVFNSNEYLPWKAYDGNAHDSSLHADDPHYTPPDGSVQVAAAMRIACYCRHQSEKEGFKVIFTLKDQHGHVVAQQMSDSILITDDHKTHPQAFSTTMAGDSFFPQTVYAPNGLPMSHSMVDLHSQMHPFTSSRSTGNLQGLVYGQSQFNPHSHVHQLPGSAYSSHANSTTTSATMTPMSMSRPASPTGLGQAGPNKKRKSSSFHRKVPSGLTMTPRVDTSQPPSSNLSSALTALTSPFSPPGEGFGNQQSYMTIPNNSGPAQFYGSGPPTPNETSQPYAVFTQSQIEQHLARAQNAQAYFSHPSSAVPSRSSSPVLQHNSFSNMSLYSRHPIQTPTNSIQGRQQAYQQQLQQQAAAAAAAASTAAAADAGNTSPTITKISPTVAPYTGGEEVSIYGRNFTTETRVLFGDNMATTSYYGPQALLAIAPPSRPGGVNVTLASSTSGQPGAYASPPTVNRHIFTYADVHPRMMEMALRQVSQQSTGSQVGWPGLVSTLANQFMSSNSGRPGLGDNGE